MENEEKGTAPKKQNEEKVKTANAVLAEKKVISETVVLTLEEKVAKVKLMSVLVGKRQKLNDTILKLDSFTLSDDSMETFLSIKEGKYSSGNEFITSNTIIIDEVAEFLKVRIFALIEKLEKEIEALV